MPDSIRSWQRLLIGVLLVMGLVPTHANADMQSPSVQFVLHKPTSSSVGPNKISLPQELIDPLQFGILIGLMLTIASCLFWFWRSRSQPVRKTEVELGFEIITPGENSRFLPLELKNYTLDYLNDIETKNKLRLSANLEKVALTPKQNSFYLEDRNSKNALLVNRRRMNKVLLQNEDVLDIGELTLLFRNRLPAFVLPSAEEGNPLLYPRRSLTPKGPLPSSTASLRFLGNRQDFPLVRNIMILGRSETCDMVLEDSSVHLRHARIFRSGTVYKLQNLSTEGTYLNSRRVEQKELHDGDEIAVGRYVFIFQSGKKR
jgi:pSer/pThr/pTyr-binding forkhead associated (FHA) protein